MKSTSPNFDDWRELDSIEVWEIASLMQGFDPRAIADVAVQDPLEPTSHYGIPPDLSWEIKRLISAVSAGLLITAPTGVVAPDSETGILKTSLVSWLRVNGRIDLADELDTSAQPSGTMPPTVVNTPTTVLPDPERRLKALRALGGDAKWTRYRSKQQWCFTKIKELTAQEKNSKRKRSDEKTIRKDLAEAADAERMKKATGASP